MHVKLKDPVVHVRVWWIMGMTGSSEFDTAIGDRSFLGVNGYRAMVELAKVHQSCFPTHESGEIKSREVELDPQESPGENKRREVECDESPSQENPRKIKSGEVVLDPQVVKKTQRDQQQGGGTGPSSRQKSPERSTAGRWYWTLKSSKKPREINSRDLVLDPQVVKKAQSGREINSREVVLDPQVVKKSPERSTAGRWYWTLKRAQARSRGGRWYWTLKRAQARSRGGKWSWTLKRTQGRSRAER